MIGRSTQGRPITAVAVGDLDEAARTLVIGVIHGDEPAGRAIARRLAHGPLPRSSALWIIESVNPDGMAADRRQNAHGVDLNRNFPWRWRPLGRRGDQQYSGRHALSEPESRAAYRLIRKLRPLVTIWFHQPLHVTDLSGGDARIERRFAAISGLPPRRLIRYPGSAASWQNHAFPKSTAFVVELGPGNPSRAALARTVRGVYAVAGG